MSSFCVGDKVKRSKNINNGRECDGSVVEITSIERDGSDTWLGFFGEDPGWDCEAYELVEAAPPIDSVNHPKHYNDHPSGVECITVVEHMTFNIGNAIKYLWRAGLKDGNPSTQDMKKAVWYIEREIDRLEND